MAENQELGVSKLSLTEETPSMDKLLDAVTGAPLPPEMKDSKKYTADEVLKMLNRTPLFMTELDETDGEGGENVELEALKALAYEGTRAEIAQNFREQGNELAKSRRFADAKGYYDKAIAAVRAEPSKEQVEEEREKEGDEGLEERIRVEELCFVNRALCNLELKNYRACNNDCASALRLNPKNVKAFYRSSLACLALDKLDAASDACERGLLLEPENTALQTAQTRITTRRKQLADLEDARRRRLEAERARTAALSQALKQRGIATKTTKNAPDLDDAVLSLAEPSNPDSVLSIPLMFLYPLHAQSDFLKQVEESDSLLDHLSYILPAPWDEKGEYKLENVDCYCETLVSGLSKVGKKLSIAAVLKGGKIGIVDGLFSVFVVPRERSAEWIKQVQARKGLS